MPVTQHNIPVRLTEGQYTVHVGPGLLDAVGEHLAQLTASDRVALMTDSNVGPLHLDTVRLGCEAANLRVVPTYTMPAGEANKTFAEVDQALGTLLKSKMERSTPLLALGGGVVGDITGFTAAILLRGVPFVQIPTSLLAMVDASVGGKTGVNHSSGKNLVGAFHQPVAVYADTETLATLPRPELVGGLAECIKHDCIRDAAGLGVLERDLDRVLQRDPQVLSDLVAHNVTIKARVVEADPFERGERAHLNFGHTFGHAIEKVSNFAYSHGQAVALGMVAAAYVSTKLGLLPDPDRRRLIELLKRSGLPAGGLMLNSLELEKAMAFDKKVEGGRIRFVLLDGLGAAVVRDDVPRSLVREAVESLRG